MRFRRRSGFGLLSSRVERQREVEDRSRWLRRGAALKAPSWRWRTGRRLREMVGPIPLPRQSLCLRGEPCRRSKSRRAGPATRGRSQRRVPQAGKVGEGVGRPVEPASSIEFSRFERNGRSRRRIQIPSRARSACGLISFLEHPLPLLTRGLLNRVGVGCVRVTQGQRRPGIQGKRRCIRPGARCSRRGRRTAGICR